MTAIDVVDLAKRYGATPALAGVNLSLDTGITGLLGPNGAGKTTMLRILATVLAPDRGTVKVLGLDPAIPAQRTDIRRRLGYVPQEPGFYPRFTAFEFVDYVAILKEFADRAERHAEVRRVLDLVGLSDVAGRRTAALSGGMRRRLAVAQAFLADPELLLLDEPLAGLDPEQRLRLRQVLTSDDTRTVVLSTHQTEDVAALCGRVIVLVRGLVAFDGPPPGLAAVAAGRVWRSGAAVEPTAVVSWRTGDGGVRHVGDPPTGAAIVDPTIEDGYLLLLQQHGAAAVAA